MSNEVDYLNEIVEYIKKNLSKGYTKESLKWALINQGYSKRDVEKAMDKVDKETPIAQTPAIQEDSAPVSEQEDSIQQQVSELEVKKPFWKKIFGK